MGVSPKRPVDLRSDTVTRPTPAMFERMASAELGDDGRGDDPTVRELERVGAAKLGKEAGLFLPSGTMSNQVAILAHSKSKGEVIGEANSHIFRSEMGGLSLLAGLYPRPLPGTGGAMDVASLRAFLRRPGITADRLGTAVVCMEQTHNAAGGSVLSLKHMCEVRDLASQVDVPVHLDGARIFNAAIALGVPAAAIAAHADSATFCISKGLSAPVGSVLTGSREFVSRARGFRRMLGGNMRQAGLLAACGLVALENMIDRLAEDHVNARRLAQGLKAIDAAWVGLDSVVTNIVMVRVKNSMCSARQWVNLLGAHGILATAAQSDVIRLVTHRHISEEDVDRTISAFRRVREAIVPRETHQNELTPIP
jgi:threonine aldolase